MSYVRLANFIQVIDSSDNVVWAYQNAAPGKTLSYDGRSYAYLSFVYQAAKTEPATTWKRPSCFRSMRSVRALRGR